MEYTYFFFLGTNPALSATEVWSVLSNEGFAPTIVNHTAEYLVISLDKQLPDSFLPRIGGVDRIARLLGSLDHQPSPKEILDLIDPLPEKWNVGLSIIGTSLNIKAVLVDLKKLARERNSRMKFALPKSGMRLNAAQVLFNGLYREPNAEITLIKVNDPNSATSWHVLRTVAVQDIAAYEKRDTARVALDQKVGMLPPKLAQMMINIAVPHTSSKTPAILDPFCGMGTILQEGWLMSYQTVGSDVSSRMTSAAGQNLQQLHNEFEVGADTQPELMTHDARQPFPPEWEESFDAIVTEPFLGTARNTPLSPTDYDAAVTNLTALYGAALRNLHTVLKPGGIVLFLLPAYKLKGERTYTPLPDSLLDHIQELGYSRVQLVPQDIKRLYGQTDRGTLLYHRPEAIVARELTLWQKA